MTIKDIARILNISKSTVSRALRDSYDVNPETRKRVMELVKELNFEPNITARSLRERRTFSIGVIIPSFQIPFYSVAIGGIQEVLSASGYNVMVSQTNESYDTEVGIVNSFLKSRVDGLLISPSKHTNKYDHIKEFINRGLPVVMFNRIVNDLEVPTVTVNDKQSAYEATRYLIRTGCNNIAHISGPKALLLCKQRKEGYLECLRDHDLSVREEWIFDSDFSIESGIRAAEEIIKLGAMPDAVFCICDSVAIGAMMTFKKRGIRIPEEISVMGFTNDAFAAFTEPSLTTVSQPVTEIGQKAAELMLLQLTRGFSKWDKKNIVLATSIVVRESTKKPKR